MNVNDFEIFKFADNQFQPFVNNKKSFLLNKHPYLDIVLTDYCNANCNFCIADLIHDKLVLNFEKLKQKVQFSIDNMNVNEVLLLGGEPTMYSMLPGVIKWLKSLGSLEKIIMTTNGIRLAIDSEYREKILSSGLTNLNVSFMSTIPRIQEAITNTRSPLTISGLSNIYQTARKYGVKVRVNNNIFAGNNDSVTGMVHFYRTVSNFCDSIKFSPILPVDNFSVISEKTEWANANLLGDEKVEELFQNLEYYFVTQNGISIINNELQFGFVKNSMIPLATPIILNWNTLKHSGMMEKVVKHNQINNLKLLSNGELSLSWNREQSEWFIKTN